MKGGTGQAQQALSFRKEEKIKCGAAGRGPRTMTTSCWLGKASIPWLAAE